MTAVLSLHEGCCANEGRPSNCLWALMLIEFLSIVFMASMSLCVRFGRFFVTFYMIHVSLLKYGEMCSFSSLRSWTTSFFVGLSAVVRMPFGSLEGRLPPRPGSSSSLAQLVHGIASAPPDVLLRASVARVCARQVHMA